MLIDDTETGDSFFDDVIRELGKKEKPKRISYWIGRLSARAGKERRRIISGMVEKGIVDRREIKTCLFFKSTRFPPLQKDRKRLLRETVRKTVSKWDNAEESEQFMAALVYSCYLGRTVFNERREYRNVRKAWAEMVRNDPLYRAIDYVIESKAEEDDFIINTVIMQTVLN